MKPGQATILFVLALLLFGCGPSRGSFLNENDKLRRENLELEKEVETLKQQNESLRLSNRELAAKLGKALKLPDNVRLDQLPSPTRITVGRYSGALDNDRDGKLDLIRLYITVYDQNERFVPLAATVRAQAVVITPGSDPQVISQIDYSAEDFESAYRSGGLTGPHYTIELPLQNLPDKADSATVKVTIDPLSSELPLTTEKVIKLGKPSL